MTPQETEKIKLMQLFKQGKIDTLPDVDSDAYKASKIKDMMSKANTNESNIEEMTRGTFERMDGLINQNLLKEFLNTFEEIYSDYHEGGDPFDSSEVIDFLSIMMQNRAEDARLDSSFSTNEEKVEETTYVWGDVRNALKDEANASESEIEAYIASLERDIKINGMDDYNGYSTDDYVEDFKNYIADKSVDEGVKWMKRFSGVK